MDLLNRSAPVMNRRMSRCLTHVASWRHARFHGFVSPLRAAVAMLSLAACFEPRPAVAQAIPLATENELVELQLKLLKQEAKVKVAKWERDFLGVANRPPADARAPTRDLCDLVGKAFSEALENGAKFQPKLGTNREALEASWRQAAHSQIQFDEAVASLEKSYEFSLKAQTPPRFRLNRFDFAVFAWIVVAFGLSSVLAVHELRRSLRRSTRARLPGGIAALFVVGLLGLSGCRGSDSHSSEPDRKAAENELARLNAEAAELKEQLDLRHTVRINAWAKLLGDGTKLEALQKLDSDLLERVRSSAEEAVLEDLFAERIAKIAGLAEEQTKLIDMTHAAEWWLMAFAAVKVAGAVILGLLAMAPYRLARRRVAAERKADSQTCPRCLAVGKLSVQKVSRTSGEYTESTYLECKACTYRIARSHQHVARLCFPTVGIRAGGKTHMLTTAYAAIQNRMTPSPAAVQTAPSVMDERFRQYIELVLRHRGETGATVHDTGFLEPLLIHARDTDRWGPNGVLVNLFDYSGELVEETPLSQELRPRAMLMDGFMMIFDPTQIYGESGVTLEDQIRALANFYQQMAEARGLPPGTMIPNPVAICITKFDLLESQNPIGGQCLPFIQQLDGPLKPEPKQPVTLATLKARSDLVEQMLPLLFPGVDLGRLVREYFGTQMLFFPMSSVNLNADEFGRIDTSSRNPAPYGVVEPILWLMHMHGYCVLDKQ